MRGARFAGVESEKQEKLKVKTGTRKIVQDVQNGFGSGKN